MSNVMEHKGFKAQIMEAPRLTGGQTHQLPPGSPLEVHPADKFVAWPEGWMKGPGVFLVPVRADKGLWFDWRRNSAVNTAVIPTVKGCNPITGIQTSGFHLEKYETKCPKHNCDFLAERFCPECNYKWPDRNYQSMSPLWLDGFFNQKDGTVRQFFFSEDELRDVASGLIGKENTVPAFGFAFYSPKERRPDATVTYRGSGFNNTLIYPQSYAGSLNTISTKSSGGWYKSIVPDSLNEAPLSSSIFMMNASKSTGYDAPTDGIICNASAAPSMDMDYPGSNKEYGYAGGSSVEDAPRKMSKRCKSSVRSFSMDAERGVKRSSVPVKEVSVGAGAKIFQKLNSDGFPLDSWKDTPDSVMTIYFVFKEKYEEIAAGGIRDLEGSKEGMLTGLTVG